MAIHVLMLSCMHMRSATCLKNVQSLTWVHPTSSPPSPIPPLIPHLQVEGKDPLYTLNAFFMSMRSKFTKPDCKIHYLVVQVMPRGAAHSPAHLIAHSPLTSPLTPSSTTFPPTHLPHLPTHHSTP